MDEITGDNTEKQTAFDINRHEPWPKGQSGNPAGRPVGSRNGPRATLIRLAKSRSFEEAATMVRERFPDETDVNVESEIAAGALDIARGMDRGKPVSAETRLKAIDFFYKQTEEPLKTTTKIEGEVNSRVTLSFRVIEPEEQDEPDGEPGT